MYTITTYEPIADDDHPESLAILHEALGTDVALPPPSPQSLTLICRLRLLDGTGWEMTQPPCRLSRVIGVASVAILDNGDGQLLNAAVHPEYQKKGTYLLDSSERNRSSVNVIRRVGT